MKNNSILSILIIFLPAFAVFCQESPKKVKVSDNIEIVFLSERTLLHHSYLSSQQFGKVECNGLIYISGNEAVVVDSPPSNEASKELLDWFNQTYPNVEIKGIIINHFHEDCLGGLGEFHSRKIKSYAYQLTKELAIKDNATVPQIAFNNELKLKVGKNVVISKYFGQAHTKDNIVTWIPDEKVLFGGCMVKALQGINGNLADANANEWSNTVTLVKDTYKDVSIVIPGHGNAGGVELLDYTINLFKEDKK